MPLRILHLYSSSKYQCNPRPYYDCNMVKTFGDRVRERRTELKLSQKALAKASGISQSTVAQIEGGRNKGTTEIISLARALSVHPEWLQNGRGSKSETNHKSASIDSSINAPNIDETVKSTPNKRHTMEFLHTEPGLAFRGEVPLISWDQARTWDSTMASIRDDETVSRLPCPAPHSAATFCIENNTGTMDDGTTSGYREGEILFVDPEMKAVPDKDVIVILPDGRMLFRRLKEDGEGLYLLALNGKRIDRWESGTIVRGVVIFSGNFR